MSDEPQFTGSATLRDGTRVQLSSSEAREFWEAAIAAEEKRARDMPTEQDALNQITNAVLRLKTLGWDDAQYCPKDGTEFSVIEAGSSGIHRAHYEGKWPNGTWWIADDGDLWPSRPILYKLDPADEEKRKARLKEMAERFARDRKG